MPKDWETIFTNWTKPPSDTEQARCDNAVSMIQNAIKADATLSKMKIEVFAQGSYANNTNVKLNSDVDVCIRNMDYLYCEYPEGKGKADFGNQDTDYSFSTYKDQVQKALENYFGKTEVKRGNKAFDIKSSSYRVEADAVACFEHRRYSGDKNLNGTHKYLSGTEFRSDDFSRIINWPLHHIDNGVLKNKNTATQFKKVVRILKKLNLEMRDNKIQIADKIPSFLIESLVWNTPDSDFKETTYAQMIRNTLAHIYNSTKNYETVKEWGEISELKYLFRDTQPWKMSEVNDWAHESWNYIGFK